MGDRTFLLADKLHINEKNFNSLLTYVGGRNVDIVRAEGCGLPIDAFGAYDAHREALAPTRGAFQHLSPDALAQLRHADVNLFAVARAELLSYLLSKPEWHREELPTNTDALIRLIHERNRDELVDGLAVAVRWIDYWRAKLANTPRLRYVGVFSGSLIYARTLLEVMRYHPGRCFVFESFFTGLHYYCEERYQPIANRSDLRLPTVLRSIETPTTQGAFEAKRNQVLAAITGMNNKNVKQPPATGARLFANDRPTLLILGQVVNDFSMLELNDLGICSIEVYRRVIERVLAETDWNVVFKAHPWEQRKAHLRRALTKQELETAFEGDSRLAIVEDHALKDLFAEAEAVACINSQSGIEAALAGFKPIQLGKAFWGGHGFSHDLDVSDSEGVASLLAARSGLRLSLDGYDRLERWLVKAIGGWLVEEAVGAPADKRLGAQFHEIAGCQAVPAKPTPAKPTPVKPIPVKPSAPTPATAGSSSTALVVQGPRANGLAWRKLRKLVRRPDQFFRDARSVAIRRFGTLFYRSVA